MSTTPESTVAALYDALNTESAEGFERVNIYTLFTPLARVHLAGPASYSNPEQFTWTIDEFLDRLSAASVSGRHEIEVAHRTERFGNIAHVFSTYELTFNDSVGLPVMRRGINSFQLTYNGSAWRIFSLIWDVERDDNPLPGEYLP